MKIQFAGLGLAIALLMPASAQAACSIEQRIELAKADYDKAEVEALCTEDAAVPKVAQQSPNPDGPDDILKRATYDGYDPARDPARAQTNIGPAQRCEFHDGFVRILDFKNTSHGYVSKDIQNSAFYVLIDKFKATPRKGSIYAWIRIAALGFSNANQPCWALYVRRENIDSTEFASQAAEIRREYDAVLQALAARGID